MSKDRLNDLKKSSWTDVSYTKIPQQADNHEDQDKVAIKRPKSTTISIDDKCSITDFLGEADAVRSLIAKIDELAQQVQQIHKDMLTLQHNPKLSSELDDKTEQIRNFAHNTVMKLKRMEQGLNKHDASNAQQRIEETQLATLNQRFRETMNRHNEEALAHQEKLKKVILSESKIIGQRISDVELDEMLASGQLTMMSGPILVETQKAKQTLSDLEARKRDILKLHRSIQELHDMFQDLNILVGTQGGMMDQIEYRVNSTAEYADKSKKNIEEIIHKQDDLRKMKIIVCAVVTVVVFLVLLVLYIIFSVQKKLFGK